MSNTIDGCLEGGNQVPSFDHSEARPNVFERMVLAYSQTFQRGLRTEHFHKGVMHFRGEHRSEVPVKVGRENGQFWYLDGWIWYNHHDISQVMWDDGVIKREPGDSLNHQYLKDKLDVSPLFHHEKGALGDGSVGLDSQSGRYVQVKINDTSPRLGACPPLRELLPPEFLSEDGSVPYTDAKGKSGFGSKTLAAVKLSRGFYDHNDRYHSIEVGMIKSHIYNPTGMGPVVYLNEKRMDIIFTKHEPKSEGPFLFEEAGLSKEAKEQKMVLVHRPFELINNSFERAGPDHLIYLNQDHRVVYANGDLVYSPASSRRGQLERVAKVA